MKTGGIISGAKVEIEDGRNSNSEFYVLANAPRLAEGENEAGSANIITSTTGREDFHNAGSEGVSLTHRLPPPSHTHPG